MRRVIVLTVVIAVVLPLGPSAFAEAPTNDDFANAVVLPGSSGDVAGTTVDATEEPGEPLHGIGATGTSVWFRWTAPADGTILLEVTGNELNSYLAAYSGDQVDGLTLVAREARFSSLRVWFRVSASTELHIAVDTKETGNTPPATAPFSLAWTLYEPPPNDGFSDAEPLSGATGALIGNNGGATAESGEPQHGGNEGGVSLWYTWSPPSSGAFRFDVSSSEFPPLMSIYTGSELDSLTPVATHGETLFMHQTVELDADAGTQYSIALDGSLEYIGDFDLSWRPSGPPNDDLEDALVLDGPTQSDSIDTTWAIKEPGEPNHAGNSGGASAWYEWAAVWPGEVTIEAEADGWDPLIAVYQGSRFSTMDELVLLHSDHGTDGVASVTIELADPAPFGAPMAIAVDGENDGAGAARGPLTFSLSFRPFNDDFEAAEPVPCCGFNGGWWGYTGGATSEAGEPNHAGTPADDSVWFSLTPEVTGTVEFSTDGTFVPARLAAYAGSALPNLVPLATSTPDVGGASRVRFDVVEGTTYYLTMDSVAGEFGMVGLAINLIVEPPEATLPPIQQVGTATVPLRVSWDGPQGEGTHFDLEMRAGASPWVSVASTTDKKATVAIPPGIAHRFRVMSTTPSGPSDWEEGDSTRVRAIQDRNAAVVYRGTWKRQDIASASGGTIRTSVDRGATAKLRAAGKTLVLVAPRGPRYGKAALFIDDTFVKTINFYSGSYAPRRVVFRRSWGVEGMHSMLLKVLGRKDARSTGNRVPLDAFLVVD